MTTSTSVLRVFPAPVQRLPARDLYLALELRRRAEPARPFCVTNFVTSLDGRISLPSAPGEPPRGVPASISSPTDWRLFQELVAQADAVVVSGRYVRDVAARGAPPIVQLHEPGMYDLAAWRKSTGLPPTPDVVVVSASLDLDAAAIRQLGARASVVTTGLAPTARIDALQAQGIDVIPVGESLRIRGDLLASVLGDLGYGTVYAAAGPVTVHTLVEAGVLDLVCITTVARMLGGRSFATLLEGGPLHPPADLTPEAMYLDQFGPNGAAQLFTIYRTLR